MPIFGNKKITELSNRLDQMENSLKDVLSENKVLNSSLIEKSNELKKKDDILKQNQKKINQQRDKVLALEQENRLIKKRLEWLEEDQRIQTEMKIVIPDKFREVEKATRDRYPLIFVHGGAGTGKSTLIQWLQRKGLIHVILAPTGLAALNVGGMTIHKAFQFAPLDLFPKNSSIKSIPADFLSVLNNLRNKGIHTICIDEISMVRADLLDAIDRALRHEYGMMPFGGFQMVFVGDLYQLPPVVEQKVKRYFDPDDNTFPAGHGWSSPWFLDSDVLTPCWSDIKRIDLDNVFRQIGAERFVRCLNSVRIYNTSVMNELNKTLHHGRPPHDCVVIVGKKDDANRENQRHLEKLRGVEHRFHAIKNGVFASPNPADQIDLPVPEDITLKVGEFVIIVANSQNGDYVNGTTGIIHSFGFDKETCEFYVLVRTSTGMAWVKVFKWTSYKIVWNKDKKHFENEIDGTYEQIPIIPGYAITCHKSQGKTLDSVFVNLDAWETGQMYVALSRTRSPRDISIANQLCKSDFPPNPRLQEFVRMGIL